MLWELGGLWCQAHHGPGAAELSPARPGELTGGSFQCAGQRVSSLHMPGLAALPLSHTQGKTNPRLPLAGPYIFNGVPLRRVNQSYVIATATKVDVSGVNVSKFDDKYFEAKKPKKDSKKSAEGFFAGDDAAAHEVTEEAKADQASVDEALISGAGMSKGSDMKMYLRSKFSLSKGQYPHMMKF